MPFSRCGADAIFIQSESSEYFHAENPGAIHSAELLNARRFLSLDLNYGRRIDSEMYEYLMDNGMTREEYHFFLDNHLKHHCIMGNDYYVTNEHRVSPDGNCRCAGEVFGYDEITVQYYDRYLLPVMHTETNLRQGPKGDEAVNWLWKEWANVLRVRNKGVPIVGFTWYSLTDQVDWDTALREPNGHVNALGLYDLNREIRPVGEAYKKLIADWREVLPTQSVCLRVPIAPLTNHSESAPMAGEPTRTQTSRPMPRRRRMLANRGEDNGCRETFQRQSRHRHRCRQWHRVGNREKAGLRRRLAHHRGSPPQRRRQRGSPKSRRPDVWASACDVSQEAQVEATVAGTMQRRGRLDVIVNNAGLMIFKSIEDHSGADWLRILSVDLLGAFYFIRQAFRVMKPGGAIVNVSSIHALQTTPLVASYAAAKAALLSLTGLPRWKASPRASASTPSCRARSIHRCCGTTRT